MTNHEYLKNLGVEELAREIYFADCNYCEHCETKMCEVEGAGSYEIRLSGCREAIIKWLEAERE